MIRDRTLAHMKFEPPESPYSFVAMVPQDVTERLLVEELRRKGGNVEYDTKFIAAEQDDYGVNVTIERRGESTEVRAAVVVGCDGAHSTVRHQCAGMIRNPRVLSHPVWPRPVARFSLRISRENGSDYFRIADQPRRAFVSASDFPFNIGAFCK